MSTNQAGHRLPAGVLDFSTMTEMDVREVCVRPLLQRLGYAHGAPANIRTNVSLRYAKAQLGRKNPRDPDLPGPRRADYVCEVISYGRFVVEAKAGSENLTEEDAAQAYSYAAHPEIAAFYFVVTNGREYRVYSYGDPSKPFFIWTFEEEDTHFAAIANILGPEAIKRRALQFKPDVNKPLAQGLDSTAEIVGGLLVYREMTADNPALVGKDMTGGAQASVLGRRVTRTPEQLISAEIEFAGPFATWTAINNAVGWETFTFSTADEFISADPDRPSIFQNAMGAIVPAGMKMKPLPNTSEIAIPFPISVKVFTQAIGFLDGKRFIGVFHNDYEMQIMWPNPMLAKLAAAQFPSADGAMQMSGGGDFEIRLR